MSARDADALLVELLDARHAVRARALRRLTFADESLHAARAVLLFDERVALRARAARKLGRWRDARAVPWLHESTRDPFPSVRESAWRALSRFGHPTTVPLAERASKDEPVWWVRRAAVVAYALGAGFAAVGGLCAALEDPFWRVRRAAVRCLAALGDVSPEVRAEVAGRSTRAQGVAADALSFLHARWSGRTADIPVRETRDATAWTDDPDPAVLTARLERIPDDALDLRDLVPLLADSHDPLRAEAARRLVRRASDPRAMDALRLALRWIDEHRLPHAKETTWTVLRRCGAASIALAREVLDKAAQHGEGSVAWALETLARDEDETLSGRAPALLDHPSSVVRCAALRALDGGGGASVERCASLLDDPDERVRDAAVEVLQGVDGGLRPLRAAPLAKLSTRARCLIVALAWRTRDVPWLRVALAQDNPWVRGLALTALCELGALTPDEIEIAAEDRDPWVRASVLRATTAAEVFLGDRDPEVRRAALSRLVESRQRVADVVVRAAVSSRDAWARAHAFALADVTTDAGLRALLALSRDTSPAVRGGAADVLEACERLDERLAALLQRDDLTEPERAAAEMWRYLRSPSPPAPLPHRERGDVGAITQVRVHTNDSAVVLPITPAPGMGRGLRGERAGGERALGRTDLRVSPLGLSGVYELPTRTYALVEERGVNLFFWEPHYGRLTRHLRARKDRDARVIVTGSFHATDAAITRDIERALRSLGRDRVDVFLLFWTRSRARLNDETIGCLERAKRAGKVRAIGFSTHDRALASEAVGAHPWDVVMTRHNAAHRGAEATLLPVARAHGTGVIAFSALCYGRLLRATSDAAPPTAADCYRYVLSQPGVSTCLTAPRSTRELLHGLEALERPTLDDETIERLRAHGRAVYDEERAFGGLVRGVTGAAMIRRLLDDGEAPEVAPPRHAERPTPGYAMPPVHVRRFLR